MPQNVKKHINAHTNLTDRYDKHVVIMENWEDLEFMITAWFNELNTAFPSGWQTEFFELRHIDKPNRGWQLATLGHHDKDHG